MSKLNKLECAQRCIAAYDAADSSDRNTALKTALSECFYELTRIEPTLQLGSREKFVFSLDNNPKRYSVLKHVRLLRPEIAVDQFIMKFTMPQMITERTKEDNTRMKTILQNGKFSITDTKGLHETLLGLAHKLINKEIVNVKLAKLIGNYNCALRINESEEGVRSHVPTRADFFVDGHVLTYFGGSKVKGGLDETRPAYAKLCLFPDTLTTGLLDIVFESPEPIDSIDKMHKTEFDLLINTYEIKQYIEPIEVQRFLPSHFRSLGARFIELLFDNDIAVNKAGSILHITRRCLGHTSCESTQRYISIKCNGEMPDKIGSVSHVENAKLMDGGFAVKLYSPEVDDDEEKENVVQHKKRRRRGCRGGRKNRNKRQCV